MRIAIRAAAAAATLVLASQAMAQIVLYEQRDFRGRAVSVNKAVSDLDRLKFDDRTRSVIVEGGRWEVCERPRYEGRCAVLRKGHYDSLREAGVSWSVSSVRPADGKRRYDAEPVASSKPVYEYRRRPEERVQEVPIKWSRAVMGPPNQRCWVERQAVPVQSNNNIGGAVLGGIVGGILGHQVGGGSGKTAATAVGAAAGAMVGSNMAGGGGVTHTTQDVQRCTTVQGSPAYWEVGYDFRGVEHRAQLSTPPGNTILVNSRGEPRS